MWALLNMYWLYIEWFKIQTKFLICIIITINHHHWVYMSYQFLCCISWEFYSNSIMYKSFPDHWHWNFYPNSFLVFAYPIRRTLPVVSQILHCCSCFGTVLVPILSAMKRVAVRLHYTKILCPTLLNFKLKARFYFLYFCTLTINKIITKL